MTRLGNLIISLEASNNTPTKTTTTATLTPLAPLTRLKPKNHTEKNTDATTTTTTSTTVILTPTPTVDQPHAQKRPEKGTTSTPESNSNNRTNGNPVKADDNHIPGPSDHLLAQQKNISRSSTLGEREDGGKL